LLRARRGTWIGPVGALGAAAGVVLAVYAAVVPTGQTLPVGSKATPFSLTVFSSASLPPEVQAQEAASAPLLFDRDTNTQHVAFAESSVQADFESAQEVRAIKVFGAAPYLLTVKADSGGSFQPISFANVPNPRPDGSLDLTQLPAGWTLFDTAAPVTTGKLLFTLTPATGGTASGLAELEVWTTAAPVSVKSGAALLERLLGPAPPPQGRLYNALNPTVNPTVGVVTPTDSGADLADNKFSFTLDRDPAQFVRAYLTYELFGQASFVSARRNINGLNSTAGGGLLLPVASWSAQVERVNPAHLKLGANTVEFSVLSSSFKEGGFTVRNVRVIGELDTGANTVETIGANQPDALGSNPIEALYDGNLETGWKPYPADQPINAVAPTVEFAFRRPTQMEAVSFYLSAPIAGELQVSVKRAGQWIDFPPEAGAVVDTGWNTIPVPAIIPLDQRVLEGVRLTFLGGFTSSAEIRELLFIGSGVGGRTSPPKIFFVYPDAGQFYGRRGYVQGFIEPWDNSSGLGKITLGGVNVAHFFGTIEAWIGKDQVGLTTQADGDAWSAELKVLYPNGETASTIVPFTQQASPASPISGVLAGSLSATVSNKGKKTLSHDESTLVFDPGTVATDTTVTITPLAEENVPALDVGMTNVTKGPRRGYRYLPHGAKFLKNIAVALPYDRALIPPGHTEDDVKTFYFDDQAGRWVELPRVSVDKSNKLINSTTDHFTDMINATVTVPDHPQTVSFNPTSMKDIKAADPGAQVNLIEPPKANNTGDARVSYPIEVPPGRQGLQPQFAVSYNSSGGNGWMGMGWDLAQRAITVETRWGVPRYHASLETETYMLEGEMLTPVAHRGDLVARSTTDKVFHTRVEGQFRKIVRHGTAPDSYWWEVTDKNGVRSIYGGDLATQMQNPNSVLKTDKGNVFRWVLREMRDLNGNRMTYAYDPVNDAGVAGSSVLGRQLYLRECAYTGDATSPGLYTVTFYRDSGVAPDRRSDVQIDARGGFKQVTANLLKRVDVKFNGATVRSYGFEYQEGAFKKTLLKSISQSGTDGRKFNEHSFAYYDDIRNPDGTYKGFGGPMVVNTGTDNLVYSTAGGRFPHTVLGGTEGRSAGFDGYVGVGLAVGTKNINVGVGFGASRAKSQGSNSFIDVDGDGLPDKVFLAGQGLYRPNMTASGALDQVSFFTTGNPKPVANFAPPSETESTTGNLSVQAFAVGLTGNGGRAITNTRDMSYLADVNGDGLVDIVSRGSVRFNNARNTGVPGFSTNSFDSDSPLGNVGGSVSKDILPDVSEDKARLEAENPLMDNIRRWLAPYDGTVRVSGGVRLVDVATDPRFTPAEKEERQNYKQADGVRVAIQHNNSELWTTLIPATDYSEHLPAGVDAITVKKGDRIHFRLQSVYDGAYDQAAWSPTVEYVSGGTTQSGIDANNLLTSHFQAGEDFVYAGRPVEATVPYRGTMRLSGLLNKTATTTDDITLRVTVTDRVFSADSTLLSETARVALEKKLAWDFVGPVTLQEDFAVGRYSGVKLDFVVDSPIDLTQLKWGELGSTQVPRPGQPQLYYTEAFQEEEHPVAPPTISTDDDTPTHADKVKPNGKAGMEPIQDEDGNPIVVPAKQLEVFDATGKPIYTMTVKYDADIYAQNRLSSPQQAWIAPKDGVILWTPWITLIDGSTQTPPVTITVPDGSVVLTAKRRGTRLAKQEILIRNNVVVQSSQGYYGVQAFRVKAGDEIFFDASTRDPAIESALATTVVQIHYASDTAWQVPITDAVDLLAHIAGTAPAPDPASTTPVDGRAMFVVRRGDSEILASQIIDFAVTPTVDLSFPRPVAQGELLYFDLFTINSAITVQANQAWARYTSASSWSVPFTGQVSLAPVLNFRAGAPDGSVTLTVLRNNIAAAQQTYQIQNGLVVNAPLSLDVTAGQTLTFAFSTANFVLSSYLVDKGAVEIDYLGTAPAGWTKQTVGSASFTINMPTQFAYQAPQDAAHYFPLNDPLFGNPYRGWAMAAYNGNGTRASLPINESLFALSDNPEDYKSSAVQHNAWFAIPAVEVERWQSQDDMWWASPAEASASRKGVDNVYDPKADDFSDPKSTGFAGASRPPKMSKTVQKTMGFGFYLSMTQSDGKSESRLDLIDMNGDRFPDVVGPGSTQYTWADGTFFDSFAGGPARKSEDAQTTIGLSVGVPASRQSARAEISQGGDRDNGEKSSVSLGASVNKGSNKTNEDLIDVNGDGLPDRVSVGAGGLSVQLNNGYGFGPAETWTSGQLTQGTSKGKAANVGFSMWNGVFGGGVSVSENHNYTNTTLMDINGDGLTDVVAVGGAGRLAVWLNTGSGFIGPIDWPGALTPYKDLKSKTPGQMAVADGASTSASGSLKFGWGFNIFFFNVSFSIGGNIGETASQPSISYTDLNGDGFVDSVLTAEDSEMTVVLNPIRRTNLLSSVKRPLGASFDMDYERVGNTYDMPNSRFVLSRLTVFDGVVGNGVDTQLTTYKYEGGFHNRFERDFYGFRKVTEEHRNTAAGNVLYRSIEREFLNDSYYRKGLLKSEILQDAQGPQVLRFTETENTYQLRDVLSGLAPADAGSVAATLFPELIRTDKRFYEGQPSFGKSTFTTHEYDTLGNITRFTDDGEPGLATDNVDATITYTSCSTYVIKSDSITVRGNGVEMRRRNANIDCATGNVTQVRQSLADLSTAITDLSYFANGNLQTVTGPANKNGQSYSLRYTYDPTVATHVESITDSFNLSSRATHNLSFGKVETTTDTNGNQTTNFYDSVGRIERIVGPYEQGQATATLGFEYHPEAVVPYAITRHVDKDAGGNTKASETIDTILFTDGLKRVIQTKKDATVLEGNASAGQDKMIVSGQVRFDAFGRTVEQRYPTTEVKASDVVNGAFNPVPDPVAPTTMDYDVLDRNTRTVIPDGSVTSIKYKFGAGRLSPDMQFETIVTDANVNGGLRGAVKHTFRDVRELITSVMERTVAGDIWTSYAYDPLKQIVQVRDDRLNTTHISYDNLGRRTAIDNPDTGRTETQYDLASNVTAKITANLRSQSRLITYAYDFNRLSAITYPNFAGNNVLYEYGTPAMAGDAQGNRAGRISKITSQMGTEERQYGKLGETVYEKKTVTTFTDPLHPSVFETRFLFETFGRLLRITYPDGEVVTNVYDSGGNLASAAGVKRVDSQGQNHSYTYLQSLLYDKFEQRSLVTQGNGVKTAYSYDAANRRLNNLTAVRQGNTIFQNLSYSYDKVGNVLGLKNSVELPRANEYGGPSWQRFEYDDLYRLTKAQGVFPANVNAAAPDSTACAGVQNSHCRVYGLDMTYDTIHNIQRKNQADTRYPPGNISGVVQKKTTYDFAYLYNPSGASSVRPHAPNHIGERAYSYDANGNQTGWTHDQNGTRRTIIWDDENRIQEVSDQGHVKTYKYDDQGQRIIKRGPQGETVYVNQFYTQRPGATGTKHVYAGTSRIASKLVRQDTPNANPNGNTPFEKDLYFYHPDHLGSSSYVTDLNGKLYEHLEYFPFGEGWIEENSNVQRTPYLFTAKELDEETGLYYFGGRYYDPRTSVWQSADPILGRYLPSLRGQTLHNLPGVGGIYNPINLGTYTYSHANPIVFKDPDGKHAIFQHRRILQASLQGKYAVSEYAMRVMKAETGRVDQCDGCQGKTADKTNVHGMAGFKADGGTMQTREEAIKATQTEIDNKIAEAAALATAGDYKLALEALASATHTVQDADQHDYEAWPHENLWQSFWSNPIKAIVHFFKDIWLGSDEKARNVKLTQGVIDKFKEKAGEQAAAGTLGATSARRAPEIEE
jgi:RHS repeat-associated protein